MSCQTMTFDPYKEIIVASDASTDMWNFRIWNPHTGTCLCSLSKDVCLPRTLTNVGVDFIMGGSRGKPFISIWSFCRTSSMSQRLSVPGTVTAMALSHRSIHLVAAIGQNIYVWEAASGNVMSIVEFHRQLVTCIKFTSNGFQFISAGNDGVVAVWLLSSVLSQGVNPSPKRVQPRYVWSAHSDAIVDLYVGFGGMRGRVVTVSADETCKVFCLFSGELIFTIFIDITLCSVVMDTAESFIALGTVTGDIIKVDLNRHLGKEDSLALVKEKIKEDIFLGHSASVTCLATSMDGSLLLSGSDDYTARLWNAYNKVCIHVLKHQGPLTNVLFTMAPSCFRGGPCLPPTLEVRPLGHFVGGDLHDRTVETKLRSLSPNLPNYTLPSEVMDTAIAHGLPALSSESSAAQLVKHIVDAEDENKELFSFTINHLLYSMPGYNVFEP